MEVWEGDPLLLNDPARVEAALREAARATNSTLLDLQIHAFARQGVTGLALLAESHISIHTWPERGYAAVDIFICGEGRDPHAAWDVIKKGLRPETFEMKEITRAIGEKRA